MNRQFLCKIGEKNNRRCGITADGQQICLTGKEEDLDQHFTFFWHSARLSRYFTLENRINDQQPPDQMMVVPALTLGIMENLDKAADLIEEFPWKTLRQFRIEAIKRGMEAEVDGIRIADISQRILAIAVEGLKGRKKGEERFLTPLRQRIEKGECPAQRAAKVFMESGPSEFIEYYRV